MSWKLASRISVITLTLCTALFLVLYFHFHSANAANTLQGTTLYETPAPNFTLTDQSGKTVSLSQFKGHEVILTFLYTHCVDVCPLTAEKLRLALTQGLQNLHPTILAVSTDPLGDTPAAIQTFSSAHGMLNQWQYLIGSQATLQTVWKEYSIYVNPTGSTVDHTFALYIINAQGQESDYLGQDFTIQELLHDAQVVAG